MQPNRPSNSSYVSPQQAQQAARALTSALSNPYASSSQQSSYYSSHYAQAYLQGSTSTPSTTPEGYTLSSTYTSASYFPRGGSGLGQSGQRGGRGTHRGVRGAFHAGSSKSPGSWYEPGNHRCTYEQCTFTGSKKTVEVHMMDRHLIYPPGWENRKRKPDWDADPSLNNGNPLPIQGTSVILDTPEAIDAWIAERKKRWPTDSRKEEREKKLQEAVERGEIAAVDPRLRGNKRQRTDDVVQNDRGRGRERGRGGRGSRARGRGDNRFVSSAHHIDTSLPKKPPPTIASGKAELASDSDSDSTSGSDMDPQRDAISSKSSVKVIPDPPVVHTILEDETKKATEQNDRQPMSVDSKVQMNSRRSALLPKPPPRIPFANRQSLLRNLLLPEIRFTVSNLSQAIHFLVDNDFLRDVELNPGDSDNRAIEVINESTSLPSHESQSGEKD